MTVLTIVILKRSQASRSDAESGEGSLYPEGRLINAFTYDVRRRTYDEFCQRTPRPYLTADG
jgi:hypothetical protein